MLDLFLNMIVVIDVITPYLMVFAQSPEFGPYGIYLGGSHMWNIIIMIHFTSDIILAGVERHEIVIEPPTLLENCHVFDKRGSMTLALLLR